MSSSMAMSNKIIFRLTLKKIGKKNNLFLLIYSNK